MKLSSDEYCRKFLTYHFRFYSLSKSPDFRKLDELRRLSIDEEQAKSLGKLVAVDELLYQELYGCRTPVVYRGLRDISITQERALSVDDEYANKIEAIVKRSDQMDAAHYCNQPPLLAFKGKRKREVTYYFNVDVNLSVAEIETEFDRFKNDMIDQIRCVQKGLSVAMPYFQIHNARGVIRSDTFDKWERCLVAYEKYQKGVSTTEQGIDRAIEKGKWDSNSELDSHSSPVSKDIKTVMILIERAEKGTFPYDENGNWNFNQEFKKITLKN